MRTQALLVAAALLILGTGAATAQSTGDPRVAKLEETVRQLERRVAALEGQLHNGVAPTRVQPDKVNWRKLQSGMTEADVERLLGSPANVDENSVFVTWWYRQAGLRGFVRFDAQRRTVEAWNEP
jgi:outer membrane protein assembly factor BamE (lipoprotein component of BamABCDE complex)